MNNEQIINQFQLKTKRQKKRAVKKDFEKNLLKLSKKRCTLRKEERNLRWEILDKPYAKGYKRTFVLREDVARSNKAEFFSKLLNMVNTIQYSHKKEFTEKRRKFGKKYQAARGQNLEELGVYEFKKLQLNQEQISYFNIEQRFLSYKKEPYNVFVFNEPWRFKLEISLNMIYKTRKIDSDLNSQIQQLENYFERNNLNPKLCKLKCRSNSWKRFNKEFQPTKKKTLIEYLNEL